jgi:hypothetical protein
MAKSKLSRYVVTIKLYYSDTIGHTIQVWAFNRRDAALQASSYLRGLTAVIGKPRKV